MSGTENEKQDKAVEQMKDLLTMFGGGNLDFNTFMGEDGVDSHGLFMAMMDVFFPSGELQAIFGPMMKRIQNAEFTEQKCYEFAGSALNAYKENDGAPADKLKSAADVLKQKANELIDSGHLNFSPEEEAAFREELNGAFSNLDFENLSKHALAVKLNDLIESHEGKFIKAPLKRKEEPKTSDDTPARHSSDSDIATQPGESAPPTNGVTEQTLEEEGYTVGPPVEISPENLEGVNENITTLSLDANGHLVETGEVSPNDLSGTFRLVSCDGYAETLLGDDGRMIALGSDYTSSIKLTEPLVARLTAPKVPEPLPVPTIAPTLTAPEATIPTLQVPLNGGQ